MYFSFNTLSSRRFQQGFHRVNLHRPTTVEIKLENSGVLNVAWRKLKLKSNFERILRAVYRIIVSSADTIGAALSTRVLILATCAPPYLE